MREQVSENILDLTPDEEVYLVATKLTLHNKKNINWKKKKFCFHIVLLAVKI